MRSVALVLVALLAMPLAPALSLPQDDAGSGRDAPDTRDGAFHIAPGVLYEGQGLVGEDFADAYLLHADAGQRIEVRVDGSLGCFYVDAPDGTEMDHECSYANAPINTGPLVLVATASGDHALRVAHLAPATYRFGYGLDAPAPSTDLVETPEFLENDADTGRDAPDAPSTDVRIREGQWYSGTAPQGDVDHYAFDAEAGQRVVATLAPVPLCALTVVSTAGVPVPTKCALSIKGDVTYEATIPSSGTWLLRVTNRSALAYRVGFVLDGAAMGALDLEGRPVAPAGTDPTCGTGAAVTATSGDGPGGLVFAALKTGTRAVVAWTTEELEAAALSWNVSGAPSATLVEGTPRTQHVFVLEGLPRGETLCFTAGDGVPRAMRLANAMYAHDGDAYVLNLLVLGNEQPDRVALERGLDNFAWRIRDATDGNVKAGRVVILYGDVEHHNSGWTSCYTTVGLVTSGVPTCRNLVDVIFTADAFAGGAASTYLDGIRDPKVSIWMNSYHQAGLVDTNDNVGAVLTHEMGHYAFGAMDLYGSLAGTDPDCYVAAKGISVMGGSRAATEYDDEVNRCPNEAVIPGYVPTWTLLREDFPLVPDRAGVIDPGPRTPGDAYRRSAFALLPLASDLLSLVPEPPQDDAGSGQDAPNQPDPSFLMQPGTWYDADGTPLDDSDYYGFVTDAPAFVNVTVDTSVACPGSIVDETGTAVTSTCTLDLNDGTAHLKAHLPGAGTWFLRIAPEAPYRFVFVLDAPALGASRVEQMDQDDAGSGRDAPSTPNGAPPVEPDAWYEGHATVVDATDHYAFVASGPSVVNLTVQTSALCPGGVVDASGAEVAKTCTYNAADGTTHVTTRLPAGGTWYLRLSMWTPYRFAFALDGPHPVAMLLGEMG